jgi:lipopolysaccharide biosynthesis glycosyltransferase
LPPWAGDAEACAAGISIRFVKIEGSIMLANYKPHFMLRVLNEYDSEAESLTYFDPDIVCACDIEFLAGWIGKGVALCADAVFPWIPESHLFRRAWSAAAEGLSLTVSGRYEEQYFNSGFVGIHREAAGFLRVWSRVMDHLGELGIDTTLFKPLTRHHPFHLADQDALNVVCMVMPDLVRSLGPEGMGFQFGMEVMWHAFEPPKPWRRNFVWDLLRSGRRVPQAHRKFWSYANGPIKSWTRAQLMLRRLDVWTAVALSRIYHSA